MHAEKFLKKEQAKTKKVLISTGRSELTGIYNDKPRIQRDLLVSCNLYEYEKLIDKYWRVSETCKLEQRARREKQREVPAGITGELLAAAGFENPMSGDCHQAQELLNRQTKEDEADQPPVETEAEGAATVEQGTDDRQLPVQTDKDEEPPEASPAGTIDDDQPPVQQIELRRTVPVQLFC
ncbi:hypothetical protein SELMODRAFT_426336 [Selaginella moellendorffii]|uniref:Uncharacterized protein n=1 Tax=Selaginella moellendorffii TaxID=88036 RepID=D8SW24_SELML|nr:hypothetical protein SELMODRAFT_426336 [Selaginella moellendorffii]